MVIGVTPTEVLWTVTKSTDSIQNFTCKDDETGNPIDITAYEFYFVARKRKDSISSKVIEILNADIQQSDSGTGTTDTFTIDLTNSLTDIDTRLYYYEIRSKTIATGDNDVWFNGTLSIQWTVQEVR